MIPWWAAILLGIGFTIWTLFCVLIGAGLVTSNAKKAQQELADLKKKMPWPEREN